MAATLPPEVFVMICEQVATPDLPNILLASSAFYTYGLRPLYTHIAPLPPTRRTVLLLTTLALAASARTRLPRLPHPTSRVQSLRLDLSFAHITANLLRLLRRALAALPHLSDLALDLPHSTAYQPTAWLLTGLRAPLARLHTSSLLDATLTNWLAAPAQESLTSLSLRSHALAPLHLPPGALPNLAALRVVHLRAPALATLAAGRPLRTAALTLFPGAELAELDALSGAPLVRATLLCLADVHARGLLGAVATRFPALEAVHVVTSARVSFSELQAMAPDLQGFTQLRQVTFMAPESVEEDVEAGERAVVGAWGETCGTLKTVILGSGQVWYVEPGSGKWKSSSE